MVEIFRQRHSPLMDSVEGFSFMVVEIKEFWHTGTLANLLWFLKLRATPKEACR